MMTKPATTSVLVLAMVFLSQAQSSSCLNGVVTGSSSTPLSAVEVRFWSIDHNFARKTTTDKDGRFAITGITTGWYVVHIEPNVSLLRPLEKTILVSSGVTEARFQLEIDKEAVAAMGCSKHAKICF